MSFNILFLSTDNAARSILAEGMLNTSRRWGSAT